MVFRNKEDVQMCLVMTVVALEVVMMVVLVMEVMLLLEMKSI